MLRPQGTAATDPVEYAFAGANARFTLVLVVDKQQVTLTYMRDSGHLSVRHASA
jgi:hypothetical protein